MQKKQEDPNANDELKKTLDQFDNETPLNLTNEEKHQEHEDPELAAKLQNEYEKFMKEMKDGFGGEGGDDDMSGLADSLSGLLKGLTESMGAQGADAEEFKNLFGGLSGMGNGHESMDGNMQELAGKLLQVFMKKDLLYQPLQQSKKNYQDYFTKQQGKIGQADLKRFKSQYTTINQILSTLDNDPQNKKKLMDLFEEMQDYGQPPAGIVSVSMPTGM